MMIFNCIFFKSLSCSLQGIWRPVLEYYNNSRHSYYKNSLIHKNPHQKPPSASHAYQGLRKTHIYCQGSTEEGAWYHGSCWWNWPTFFLSLTYDLALPALPRKFSTWVQSRRGNAIKCIIDWNEYSLPPLTVETLKQCVRKSLKYLAYLYISLYIDLLIWNEACYVILDVYNMK